MIVMPRSVLLDVITAITGGGGVLNGALVGLFKSNTVLTPDTVLADLTEADFTGYAQSAAVTWGSPGYDVNKVPEVLGDMKVFNSGTPITITNVVYGYFVVDGAGTTLLYAEKFATPASVINADQMLAVVPRVQGGSYSS